MANALAIASPQFLQLTEGENIYYGGDQEWYPTHWQRRAGCGPTTASLLMLYLSRTREGAQALCDKAPTKDGFLDLMEEVWLHINPGSRGVHKPHIFTGGAQRYGMQQGLNVVSETFHIPPAKNERPSAEELCAFMKSAMEGDRPVAFLNLSNGKVENLYGWHWVVLGSFNEETMHASMYDEGKLTEIDLALWLETTVLGGALVTLEFTGAANCG